MTGLLRALCLVLATFCGVAGARAAGQPTRRFALIVGNNEGGGDTRRLLYAGEDARKMQAVFTQLGGVRPEDTTLLLDRPAGDFWQALGRLEATARAATAGGQRTVLLVYYSGHAKDGELRLGGSRIGVEALKERLRTGGGADVRIAILDACRSGVVNRTKGARKGPAFEIEAEGIEDARGLVLLTSSSANEDSQESDSLAGSYFSHHLASGLRGGADRSGDRRVTLSEAYEYAYARTVAETAETAAGAQHPTFSFDLEGNGNLVLAELGQGREGLYLPPQAPAGVYYFVDASRGVISAEVLKTASVDRVVALSPGRYRVKRRLADRLRIGDVVVAGGRYATLDEGSLRDAPFSDDPVATKGELRERVTRFGLSLGGGMQAFFDAPTRKGLFPPTGLVGAELSIRDFFRRDWVVGFDLALGGTQATLVRETVDAPLPFRFAELNLGASLLVEWPLGARLAPFIGGRMAFILMSRKFEGSAAGIPDQFLSTFSPGLLGGLRYRLGADFSLLARGRLHYLHYNIDEDRSLGYWELAAVLAYEL